MRMTADSDIHRDSVYFEMRLEKRQSKDIQNQRANLETCVIWILFLDFGKETVSQEKAADRRVYRAFVAT